MNKPSLQSPTNNVNLQSFHGFLSVSKVTGATGYEVQYDSVNTFNSSHLRSEHTESTSSYVYTEDLRKGVQYFWRARAYKTGDTSGWSNPWNLTVFTKMKLNTPSDGLTGPLRSLYCTSAGRQDQVEYLFEVDTVSTFNSSNYKYVSRTYRAVIDSALFRFGQKLYWRATAVSIDFNDTLDWSDTWSYNSYTQTSIYNISSPSDPLVVVSWASMQAADVILQLDTTPNFGSTFLVEKVLKPGTLRDTLKNLRFGQKYFIRVKAHFNGDNTPWTDTDSFEVRETSRSYSPANNSTIQNLTTSFNWSDMDGCVSQAQVCVNQDFTTLLIDTTLDFYRFNLMDTLDLNTRYYWRIRHFHEEDTSNWDTLTFTTYTGQVYLRFPNNGVTNLDVQTTLRFSPLDWADSYVLELDTGTSFGAEPSSYRITATDFYNFSIYKALDTLLRYGTTHVWRVYAIRGSDTAEASGARILTTKSAPKPNYPSNNYIGIGTQTNLLMELIVGSDSAIWELDTTPEFNSPLFATGVSEHVPDDFTPKYTLIELPGDLRFETKYYWHVKFFSKIDTSDYSTTYNFTTTQQPWLTSPANNSANVSITPTLKWGVQGSAEDYIYQYQMSSDSAFTSAVVKSVKKGESAEAIESCDYNTTYFWRGRASHSKDTSSWSLVWKFTTRDKPTLPKPVLSSPSNGVTNVPLPSTVLRWLTVTGAYNYDVQIASENSFTNILAQANVTGTAVTFNGMNSDRTYFWHVRANAPTIIGPWSDTWAFRTTKSSGIDDVDLQDRLYVVYPNPANDLVTISHSEMCSYIISHVHGQVVKENEWMKFDHEVEIGDLTEGVYWLTIRTESSQLVKKLVVRH